MSADRDVADMLPKRLKYFTPLVRIEPKYGVRIGDEIFYFSRNELEDIEQQCSAAIQIYDRRC